jgi:hypothetical protein
MVIKKEEEEKEEGGGGVGENRTGEGENLYRVQLSTQCVSTENVPAPSPPSDLGLSDGYLPSVSSSISALRVKLSDRKRRGKRRELRKGRREEREGKRER